MIDNRVNDANHKIHNEYTSEEHQSDSRGAIKIRKVVTQCLSHISLIMSCSNRQGRNNLSEVGGDQRLAEKTFQKLGGTKVTPCICDVIFMLMA